MALSSKREKKIGILLYADDIVLISPTCMTLKKLCKLVEDWLHKYEIDINAEKSEIVVYNGNQKPNIQIKDKLLKITNNYKYLGFIADKRISSTKHFKERCEKMKTVANLFMSIMFQMKGVTLKRKRMWPKHVLTLLYSMLQKHFQAKT